MKSKVILIVCDGMRADVAAKQMGYVESLCHNRRGHKWIAYADNPSVSKTNYETIVTGMPSIHHGVVTNLMSGRSKMKRSIFSEVKARRGKTACLGSHWFYDLHGSSAPFNARKHKEVNDPRDAIQIGRFQTGEEVSSAELLETADFIVHKYNPDFMLIHVQDIDHIGHTKGLGKDYIQAVEGLDELLGIYLPTWLKTYTVIINADHGMDKYKNHGGTACDVVTIPFYILPKMKSKPTESYLRDLKTHSDTIYQVDVARIVLDLMGIHDFGAYQRRVFNSIGFNPADMTCHRNLRTHLRSNPKSKSRPKSKSNSSDVLIKTMT